MCGFLCQFNFTEKINDNDTNTLKNLAVKLSHRGPDMTRYYQNKNFHGIFHRLSIRDLNDRSMQPFISRNNRYLIFFNGEIYNTNELLKHFPKNYLKTSSDTELLIELFSKYKINFLDLIEGMYSIVIYDTRNKSCFLFRDRFGIKPLYYKLDKDKISFSSEIKPLITLSKNFNEKAIYEFLALGYLDSNEKTFFKDIISLKSGSFLKIENNEIIVKEYWNLKYSNKSLFINKDKKNFTLSKKNELKYLLHNSIENHLISDVEIGLMLSGGADSSALAIMLKNKLAYQLKTFTYDFDDNNFGEAEDANKISKKLNIKNYVAYVTPKDVLKNFNELTYKLESPFTSLRLFGVDKVYKLAKKKKLKVILEGHGGDEMNAGYSYNYLPFLIDHYIECKDQNYVVNAIKSLKKNNLINSFFTIFNQGISTTDGIFSLNNSIINKDFLNDFRSKNKFKFSNSYLISSQLNDIRNIKLPRILKYTDRISMSQGIEARVPFLDHKLFEFCFNLPHDLKFNNGISRFLFKNIIMDINSDLKLSKNKKTIVDPQSKWLKTHLKDFAIDIFSSNDFFNNEYIDRKFFLKYLDKFYKNKLNSSFAIFNILSFQIFLNNF